MVEFEGLDTIIKRLDKIIDADEIAAQMGTAALLVEDSAVQNAPKDEGDLQQSITSKVERTNEEITAIVYSPLEYAPYVEYGTGLFAEKGNGRQTPWGYEDEETGETIWTCGQKPQPFMRPALEDNKQNIINLIRKAFK
jgi:HK97 gp10 family phage protein